MYALMEHDLKSLLAYHSVENIGIILLGHRSRNDFSELWARRNWPPLDCSPGSTTRSIMPMFKALLFLGAGSLLYATHTRNMEEYGGLLRRMPWTGAFFLIGAVSIFRATSHQWIRQRVAGLPKPLPQFSASPLCC